MSTETGNQSGLGCSDKRPRDEGLGFYSGKSVCEHMDLSCRLAMKEAHSLGISRWCLVSLLSSQSSAGTANSLLPAFWSAKLF